jgi:ubiquinone/menaquinone biosynthesis C-methylase UbiE
MIRCVPFYLELITAFTNELPTKFKPKRILDLGCGNGNVTAHLLQYFPNANYVLLDASKQMIDLCRTRFNGFSAEYITSYFKDYEFKAGQFDMIIAGFSVHHCDSAEKRQLFKRIFRSLKPGGIFGCSDLMIDKTKPEHIPFLKKWESFVNQNYPDGEKWEWLMEHYQEFDKPESLEKQLQWLREAGFKQIEETVLDHYWTFIRAIK